MMSEPPQKKFTAYFREMGGNTIKRVNLGWCGQKFDLTDNNLERVVAEGEKIFQIFRYGAYEFKYSPKNRTLTPVHPDTGQVFHL